MEIYEYQAKDVFRRYGIPVPRGSAAKTPDEAVFAGRSLETLPVVVKAQIFAGGRGSAGAYELPEVSMRSRRRPIVVRLEGTNKEKGRDILATSAMSFLAVDTLKEGAERIRRELGKVTG